MDPWCYVVRVHVHLVPVIGLGETSKTSGITHTFSRSIKALVGALSVADAAAPTGWQGLARLGKLTKFQGQRYDPALGR
jgi:hypothetical protein